MAHRSLNLLQWHRISIGESQVCMMHRKAAFVALASSIWISELVDVASWAWNVELKLYV